MEYSSLAWISAAPTTQEAQHHPGQSSLVDWHPTHKHSLLPPPTHSGSNMHHRKDVLQEFNKALQGRDSEGSRGAISSLRRW